jgi:hypothetical protein
MDGKSHEVYWRGQLVGYVVDPKVDNYHFYGLRRPANAEAAQAFLRAVREGRDVFVGIDDPTVGFGTVDVEPGDEIEINFRPN